MRLHPDGVAEGTPEECAAFKHIDAALAQRNKPMKAIEAKKGKRAITERNAAIRKWGQKNGYAVSARGHLPRIVIAAYQQAHPEE